MDENSVARGSVSRLIGGMRGGDGEAVRRLWDRYFRPMVRLARARLAAGGGRCADAEDVALDAFFDLCRQAALADADARFPQLRDRSHLWKLLACFTARQAFDVAAKERRRSAVVSEKGDEALAALAGREPPPEFAAAVADLFEHLPTDDLRAVAAGRLEGRTNPEIARRLGCALATVERKLQVVRILWAEAEGGSR